MKYRIIKEKGQFKVQERGWNTLWLFWRTWTEDHVSTDGFITNYDIEFDMLFEAEFAIKQKRNKDRGFEIIKTGL